MSIEPGPPLNLIGNFSSVKSRRIKPKFLMILLLIIVICFVFIIFLYKSKIKTENLYLSLNQQLYDLKSILCRNLRHFLIENLNLFIFFNRLPK